MHRRSLLVAGGLPLTAFSVSSSAYSHPPPTTDLSVVDIPELLSVGKLTARVFVHCASRAEFVRSIPRLFMWDEHSQAADDGGVTVVAPPAAADKPGRWIAQDMGQFDIGWFGAAGDGKTDDTDAFKRAFAGKAPRTIVVPATGNAYLLSTSLTLPENCYIKGYGSVRPVLRMLAKTDRGIHIVTPGCTIEHVYFDGNNSDINTHATLLLIEADNAAVLDCHVVNATTFGTVVLGRGCRIERCHYKGTLGTAIALRGRRSTRNTVSEVSFEDNRGFGVWVADGSNKNVIERCITQSNGLELIGITYDCYENRVVGNHAEGTGDNGISITGYLNTIQGNVCIGNRYHGIGVWGERNTVTGNICSSNGRAVLQQDSRLSYAGIALVPGFGGFARDNTIVGNVCNDSQASPTQDYGIKIERSYYKQWRTAMSFGGNDKYFFNGINLYRAMGRVPSGLVSGDNEPTHDVGSLSDGSYDWQWVGSLVTSFDRPCERWSSGSTISEHDRYRVNGKTLYFAMSLGTTGTNPPGHSEGITSDGSILWRVVRTAPDSFDAAFNTLSNNIASGNAVGGIGLLSSGQNDID